MAVPRTNGHMAYQLAQCAFSIVSRILSANINYAEAFPLLRNIYKTRNESSKSIKNESETITDRLTTRWATHCTESVSNFPVRQHTLG